MAAKIAAFVIAIVGGLITWLLGLLNITIAGGWLGAIINLIISAIVLLISGSFVPGLKVKGFGLFADWAIAGPHTVRAQYIQTDDTKGSSTVNASPYIGPARGNACGATSTVSCADGTGAKLYSLVYSYAFSKRTEGSVVYTKLDNDSNAAFSLGKVGAVAGNSQSSMGIAVKHRF